MIDFKCSVCGKQYRIKDDAAGKQGKCSQCGEIFRVPFVTSKAQHPTTPPAPPPAATTDFDLPFKIALGTVGAGLFFLAISPFFRWVNIGLGGITGIAGDGRILFAFTIVAIILFGAATFYQKWFDGVVLSISLMATLVVFWMGGLIWKLGASFRDLDNPFAAMLGMGPGAGLYLGLIGGLLSTGALGYVAYRRLEPRHCTHYYYIIQASGVALGVVVLIFSGERLTDQDANVGRPSPFSPGQDRLTDEIERLHQRLMSQKTDVLANFTIEQAQFVVDTDGFLPERIVELAVRNGTGRTVSRAYFHGVLFTPGREMPWVDEEFNYSITGGLEPGESAKWRLSPNRFGPWGNAPTDRDDLALIVRVVQLDGADGESFTGEYFRESDADRLEELLDEVEYENETEVRQALSNYNAWRANRD